MTLNQLWGTVTPEDAKIKLKKSIIKIKNPSNLEDWILSKVGPEIYETFIKGYTTKQWGVTPDRLPSFIIKRLPLRLTYDDRYFSDRYQGIPIGGYTKMFENILDHKNIKINTNIDFFENKEIKKSAKCLVYTGKIDQYYDYVYGQLEYRSLKFDTKVLDGDYQGSSIINYTSQEVPFTRVVEHKHFERKDKIKTVVTWEYPQDYDESKTPYYPINNKKNNILYNKYFKLNKENVIFGGRLGTYRYYDMHQIIAQALAIAEKNICK